jgi:hypothetical protein
VAYGTRGRACRGEVSAAAHERGSGPPDDDRRAAQALAPPLAGAAAPGAAAHTLEVGPRPPPETELAGRAGVTSGRLACNARAAFTPSASAVAGPLPVGPLLAAAAAAAGAGPCGVPPPPARSPRARAAAPPAVQAGLPVPPPLLQAAGGGGGAGGVSRAGGPTDSRTCAAFARPAASYVRAMRRGTYSPSACGDASAAGQTRAGRGVTAVRVCTASQDATRASARAGRGDPLQDAAVAPHASARAFALPPAPLRARLMLFWLEANACRPPAQALADPPQAGAAGLTL